MDVLQKLRRDVLWYAFAQVPDGWVVVCMIQDYADTPEVWEVSRSFARTSALEQHADPDTIIWVRVDALNADQAWSVQSYWRVEMGLSDAPTTTEERY